MHEPSPRRASRRLGLVMVAFPLAVQAPFGWLAATFSYPDILLRPPDEMLVRFHAGGAAMVWAWYAYAACTAGLLAMAVLLPRVLGARGAVAQASVALGVVAAVAQALGLLRWVLVVPWLAARWVEDPGARPALAVAYEVQHRLFGVVLGEHLGQAAMGGWTLAAAVLLARAGAPRWLVGLGAVCGGLFWLGLGAGLVRVVPLPAAVGQVPVVAFVLWSGWCVAAGVGVLRSKGWRAASSEREPRR